MQSLVVALQLPHAAAQGLQGRTLAVEFEISQQRDPSQAGDAAAVQREKAVFHVPR